MGSRHEHDDPHDHGQRLDPEESVPVVGAQVQGGDSAPAPQRESALKPPGSGEAEVSPPPGYPARTFEPQQERPLLRQGDRIGGAHRREDPGRLVGAQTTLPST